MAKLGEVFNVSDVPERTDFTPVPPGQYVGMVTSSELKDTKSGGQMIVLEIDIQDGDHSGRKLFERLNIKNSNETAVTIAYQSLAELIKALGKDKIKDTEELHNKRFLINVAVDPPNPYVDKDGNSQPGSAQNSIKKFLPYGAATPVSAPSGTVQTPKPVESGSDKAAPPWARKKSQ